MSAYDATAGPVPGDRRHNPAGIPGRASIGQVGLLRVRIPGGRWRNDRLLRRLGKLGPESHGDYLGLVLPTAWMSAESDARCGHLPAWVVDSFNVVKARR